MENGCADLQLTGELRRRTGEAPFAGASGANPPWPGAAQSGQDQTMVLGALAALLALEQDIEVVTIRGESKARVIVLTTFARSGYLRRALEAGVFGYPGCRESDRGGAYRARQGLVVILA